MSEKKEKIRYFIEKERHRWQQKTENREGLSTTVEGRALTSENFENDNITYCSNQEQEGHVNSTPLLPLSSFSYRSSAQAARPWRGLKNLFHEHQAIKFGGSFTGRTEQTVPTGNPILGDGIDHRFSPVYCVPSSPVSRLTPLSKRAIPVIISLE
ncbi:hypothetical protein AVEN_26321-1 [Araneus ventricosus]|uniref:Uncharacterized protein n=1 Tax=Araneus ventricosus TaxID=182803 RepID=A0A4Y2ALZ8_ARAVE|nr:hypothetical protein AVEN_26321-1 [Araneus ventricosus]